MPKYETNQASKYSVFGLAHCAWNVCFVVEKKFGVRHEAQTPRVPTLEILHKIWFEPLINSYKKF